MMNQHTSTALAIANRALSILKERGEKYDNEDTIEKFSSTKIMLILYPEGLQKASFYEYLRYRYISWIVEKLCRYRKKRSEGDLLDMANYCFLLGAVDMMEDRS